MILLVSNAAEAIKIVSYGKLFKIHKTDPYENELLFRTIKQRV